MKTIGLAFRNLSRQKKRSFLLGGAIAFGFFIVTFVDALAGGSLRNLSEHFRFCLVETFLSKPLKKTMTKL